MSKVIPINNKKMELFKQDLQEAMREQTFSSLEEANTFLKEFFEQRNSSGIQELCGLSPTKMQVLLYHPMKLGSFIKINPFDSSLVEQCQIIRHAYFLLSKINEISEMRLTEKGNLPRNLVKDFWFTFYKDDKYSFEPNREEDCLELTRIKCLLEYSGLTRKLNKKIKLTKNGLNILSDKKSHELYLLLIEACFNDWNWSYMDRYAENQIIQMSGQFSLLLLSENAQDWVSIEEIGKAFVQAFPNAPAAAVGGLIFSSPEETLIHCLNTRFFERVCSPFGLIEWENKKTIFGKLSDKVRITSLFKQCFSFNKAF